MKDRTALNSFLKEAGFATSGDLVVLEPSASETREIRSSEKAVVATVSTRARDRHGDVVDPSGVRLERFRKNPVVLYAHDYDGLPVARSLWERLRCEGNSVELIAKPQFHLDTELSREVWALVEKGVLSAWSVGFIPEKWEPMTAREPQMNADGRRLKDSGRDGGRSISVHQRSSAVASDVVGFRVTRWDLLEYSCVPVPANFQALTHELKARRITAPALVKSLAPLGLEGPDLVPAPIAARKDRTLTAKTPRTATAEGGGTAAAAGAKRPAVLGALGDLAVEDVAVAVSRAFDRWLLRARGNHR